jgi:hypothetical protein
MDYSAVEYIAGVTSKQVILGKCLLLSVVVAGDGADGDLQVYDGSGTGDPQKLHLEVLSGTSHTWRPAGPVRMLNGIYVVVNTATTKATIEYLPLPRS